MTSNSSSSPTISLRLNKPMRDRLQQAMAKTRRSRSFLMQEALARYLDDIEVGEIAAPTSKRLATLLSLGGAGRRAGSFRSAADVDAHIRWLRENG